MSVIQLEVTEQQIIEGALRLSQAAKRMLLRKLLVDLDLANEYSSLTDEELALSAEALFLELDKAEVQNGHA